MVRHNGMVTDMARRRNAERNEGHKQQWDSRKHLEPSRDGLPLAQLQRIPSSKE